MRSMFTALLIAGLLPITSTLAAPSSRESEAIAASQGARGRDLPDANLMTIDGKTVRLSDYRGRPLLVTMIYTGCIDVCPTFIESLRPAVEAAQKALGADSFATITVGFDTLQDTPNRMRAYARARGIDLPNWDFLSTDEANLHVLASAVGFAYYSRATGFDHFAQVSIVDAGGRVYQQVYGAVFEPPLVVEPLKFLVLGRGEPLSSLARLIDRVRFFCTVYDPSAGRYYFNYSLFMTIGIGFACFGAALVFLLREWRRGA
jgi:protein SCO1